jgi:serine/threonine-protein kinase
MALATGGQIGHYRITSLIGKGGMGEVYRALDTTLKREVALKLLPAPFLQDADRIARFQREAEVLASLDHPNIGPIHGIVEVENARALVLALIEGPTLADRIEAGPFAIDEAIAIAKQVVDALEYAHERGIVHRDLKPANIKLTAEGTTKVLDFGLAKVLEEEPASSSLPNSPTLTMGHTRAGMILGTAAYMSPEQAIGRRVDRRSDIFSFGAVLYEMLTGERAFLGNTTPDVLEAVVKSEPDWSKLPPQTSPAIRNLLSRCLTKDRKERLQAIGEARIVLNRPDAPQPVHPQTDRRPAPWIVATAALAALAAAGWWMALKPRPAGSKPVMRFATTIAEAKGGFWPVPILSRDGKLLAYESANRIYIRRINEFEAKPVAGTEGTSDSIPPSFCFSPDDEWIAFESDKYTQLRKVPVNGGAPLTLAEVSGRVAGSCDWADDGRIYFADYTTGIERVAASGGRPESLVTSDAKKGELTLFAPRLLTGGKQVLFGIATTAGASGGKIGILNLQTHEKRILLESAGTAYYARTGSKPSSGHLVYFHNGSLLAAPFDVDSLQVGTPVQVANDVGGVSDVGFYGVSDSGTLAYLAGGSVDSLPASTLSWVDRQGKDRPLPFPARTRAGITRISPDGRRAVAPIVDPQTLTTDLWGYDFAGNHLTRITFGGTNYTPVWAPDSKRLIYWFTNSPIPQPPGELRSISVDSSAPPVAILASSTPLLPNSISPDGKVLLAARNRPGSNDNDLWMVPLDASSARKPTPWLQSEKFNLGGAAFSPDGRWVSYRSNESGRDEIYVSPYPGPGGKIQVSVDGGTASYWNRNGREIDFVSGKKVMAVDVQTTDGFRSGIPKLLFEVTPDWFILDMAPDTTRFLATRWASAAKQSRELRVVLNWFEELRQRAK